MKRYIVSYRKHDWIVVYDGPNRSEALAALVAESAKGRTMVCWLEAPDA